MPRSNRPRGRRRDPVEERDLRSALFGSSRTETRRGVAWNVQPVSGASAVKSYICPGCSLGIEPGTAHVVAWRADGLMGEADDLAARRHWHSHCWKIS
ncbi:hypothetical protein FB562_0697 [Homoserinimonas aerilata]|uniref:ATP/GTP-binding protein n=1 Tax=Homoserinimonas aerilata TaxID=1162970 RepID=A0A542YHY2_9MICO|nr:hypothetical protein [Homoserinimonas aerilata]TQL47631.1 hypothetical protein FB562_0697 [Homoserinimonas aerilata]